MKEFFLVVLAGIGVYAVVDWYKKNPRSLGSSNPVAAEAHGYVADCTNFSSSTQMTSGVPAYNETPIANGHGDQVSAAYHSNDYSTLDGGPNYQPAFGPNTNQ